MLYQFPTLNPSAIGKDGKLKTGQMQIEKTYNVGQPGPQIGPLSSTTVTKAPSGKVAMKDSSFTLNPLEVQNGGAAPTAPANYGHKLTGIQLFSSNVPNQQTQLAPLIGDQRSNMAKPTDLKSLTLPLLGAK